MSWTQTCANFLLGQEPRAKQLIHTGKTKLPRSGGRGGSGGSRENKDSEGENESGINDKSGEKDVVVVVVVVVVV